MKTHRSLLLVLLAALSLAATRDELWKKVEEAQKQGLPQTAITNLVPIIDQALKEKAWGEAVKAIGRRIALEGNIQGNKPEERIVRLQAEIAKAPAAIKPMLRAVLAHWYWHYFQQNRWRFMRRSATAAPPGDDMQTWDLTRILAAVDDAFQQALAAAPALQATPIAEYAALLSPGTVPDSYRPTLFDFVAHEALAFYQSGEQAGAKAEDAFEIDAASPIFDPPAAFLRWQPESADAAAPLLRAVRLYQALLAFHAKDAERTAAIDADLLRLEFAHNAAVGENREERYRDALGRFIAEWADHPVSARARYHLAQALRPQDDVAARAMAKQGADAFPEEIGGKLCWNLVREIEARELSFTTERVWNAPWPAIAVTYRNLDKVHFRAVPWEYEGRLKRSDWGDPESLEQRELDAVLARTPAKSWEAALPPTPDYRWKTQDLPVPADLKPGFYYIVASHAASFTTADNPVFAAPVWVSDLAIVLRTHGGEGGVEGFVLSARGGTPLADATLRLWTRGNNGVFAAAGSAASDANGLFRFAPFGNKHFVLLARHGGSELATTASWAYGGGRSTTEPFGRTIFFTDRALYRPGQTIRYKGLCIRADQQADNYAALGGQNVTVIFKDVNNKEIARQQHKANDWGSFSGSFTAPRDRLAGRMSLVVEERSIRGQASVSVEEYKRPKFQVALEAPREAARLDAPATLAGKATTYTGMPVGGAKVRWRVQRGVEFPHWWRWYCWWGAPAGDVQEIAHGTAVTDADGSFKVTFSARPDRSVDPKGEPRFVFTVSADVTDTTGETRSDEQRITVGYTALAADCEAPEWLEAGQPVKLTVRTTTFDGVAQAAEGTVRIHALQAPAEPVRPPLQPRYWGWRYGLPATAPPAPDLSDPNSWPAGAVVAEARFKTDATKGQQIIDFKLPAGAYRALLETRDRFGKAVTARLPLQVVEVGAKRFKTPIPNLVTARAWSLEPGEAFLGLWGTGHEEGRAYVEIEHRGKLLKSFWTAADRTQEAIEFPVGEAQRGGFTFRVTQVRDNRAYLFAQHVDVPWSNKKLTIKWERFISKLEPGARVTWTATVAGPDAARATAEMVAGLYDASLDAYLPHNWPSGFDVFRMDRSNLSSVFANVGVDFNHLKGSWPGASRQVELRYRAFPAEFTANLWGYGYLRGGPGGRATFARRMASIGDPGGVMAEAASGAPPPAAPMALKAAAMADGAFGSDKREAQASNRKSGGQGAAPAPDLSKVAARKNLEETAFFFPLLVSGADGTIRMEFTMPEALTEWKFLGFAHDRELRGGLLQDTAVTAKELMVEPNPPRFVREGDTLEFTAKVSNRSAARQQGRVRLTFADARTLESADVALGNRAPELAFDVPAGESRGYSWRIAVPDGMGFLSYKVVGATGRLSDGEEGWLPVLARRVPVIESLPLPIRGPATKEFAFDRLLQSGKSKTLQHTGLTVQMVSQPAWYAVMALPYLMEYPYECTEQTFNRLYANALARHIANADPRVRQVFEQWKGTPALASPLEKSVDLKSVALEETPWVRQADDESAARRNVGILFDANRLDDETRRLANKIAELQLGDGSWPWFPGGRGNHYITLYIATGFGRLRHLGVKGIAVDSALRAQPCLDAWADEWYRAILKAGTRQEPHLTPTAALYLYGRSFFIKEKPVAAGHKEAFDFWVWQARTHWLKLANRQSQGHLAVALKRLGDAPAATAIVNSIRERAVRDEELGMFWRDTELSWWWYRAPIETQAMMIELFDEVAGDAAAVEECRVWLLKQKQTQDWKTTKATADAIYGLLLRGADLLASSKLVEVKLGDAWLTPTRVEAGTGMFEERFAGAQVKPAMGRVTLKKSDAGVSWGSLHWQYLEEIGKVPAYAGTPLKLRKELFTREHTSKGPLLKPVKGALAVGDELVVKIELRSDRDMEYVHLKDQRGSGTEPVDVLSSYRYQDGLAYYMNTRDTATHFFIDYLPKGVYVLEYALRVQHRGQYQAGVASIQCMYAPEFNSHSESIALTVR